MTTRSRTAARDRFTAWMATLYDIEGAVRLLDWDRETIMPAGGAEARGRQVATLRTLRHREILSPGVDEIVDELDADPETSDSDRAALRLARREIRRAQLVPERLVRALSEATSAAVTSWLETRPTADFASFAPALERVIDLSREVGEAVEIGDEPYDGLLDEYEPGARATELEPLFAELRANLQPIADRLKDAPAASPFADRYWPEDAQLALAEDVARLVGFDLRNGLIALSAHPFTDSPHSGDVRFTTRITPGDPTGNILVTLHEAGHALYAQGHPAAHDRTFLFLSASLGAEESQSRFYENHVGRSLVFWEYLMPALRTRFGKAMDGLSSRDFHRVVTRAARSWCRVDADEITYDLHIVLRFELELALIRGTLAVRDLPEAWRDGMQRLLGITPVDDAQGCMQDIHWAWGMLGYFPTYTLGNIYAAQLTVALESELGSLDSLIGDGRFADVLGFMRQRVHVHGSRYPTAELMERATGQPFSTAPYLARIARLAAGD